MFQYKLIQKDSAKVAKLPAEANPDNYYYHEKHSLYIEKKNKIEGSKYVFEETEYDQIKLIGIPIKKIIRNVKLVTVFNPFKTFYGTNVSFKDLIKSIGHYSKVGQKNNPLTNVFIIINSNTKKKLSNLKSPDIICEVKHDDGHKKILNHLKLESSKFISSVSMSN
jgi:hypothetical protein